MKLKTIVFTVILVIIVALATLLGFTAKELKETKVELSNQTINEENGEISPCPFCGSNDLTLYDMRGDGTVYEVKCNNCHSFGPMYRLNGEMGDISKEEAIEYWNNASN